MQFATPFKEMLPVKSRKIPLIALDQVVFAPHLNNRSLLQPIFCTGRRDLSLSGANETLVKRIAARPLLLLFGYLITTRYQSSTACKSANQFIDGTSKARLSFGFTNY
jgi:hypothetical protein